MPLRRHSRSARHLRERVFLKFIPECPKCQHLWQNYSDATTTHITLSGKLQLAAFSRDMDAVAALTPRSTGPVRHAPPHGTPSRPTWRRITGRPPKLPREGIGRTVVRGGGSSDKSPACSSYAARRRLSVEITSSLMGHECLHCGRSFYIGAVGHDPLDLKFSAPADLPPIDFTKPSAFVAHVRTGYTPGIGNSPLFGDHYS